MQQYHHVTHPPYIFYHEVMHGIIVACNNPLSCCIYTALVSLILGISIASSFNILNIFTFFKVFVF